MVDLILGDRVLDAGLAALDSEATHIYVCSAQPTTYAEASSAFALGNKNFGAGAVFASPTAGSPGRSVTSVAISGGAITASGTVAYWAVTDNAASRLLATGALTSGAAVTTGQSFTLDSFTIQMSGEVALGGGPYVGPGESPGPTAVGGGNNVWRAWWGMRAFTAAIGAAGTNAIRIRDSTTTTETNIRLTSTGGLNAADISAALPSGHSGTIVTFYDQTGNGQHLTQATAALQPEFIASAVGGKPSARFAAAHALAGTLGGSVDITTTFEGPFAFVAVCMSTGSVASIRNMIFSGAGGNTCFSANNGSATHVFNLFGGGSMLSNTATDGVYHTALPSYFETPALSTLYVDGASGTPIDITSAFISLTNSLILGANDSTATSQPLNGDICEFGIYSGNISSYASVLDTNLSAYYSI